MPIGMPPLVFVRGWYTGIESHTVTPPPVRTTHGIAEFDWIVVWTVVAERSLRVVEQILTIDERNSPLVDSRLGWLVGFGEPVSC